MKRQFCKKKCAYIANKFARPQCTGDYLLVIFNHQTVTHRRDLLKPLTTLIFNSIVMEIHVAIVQQIIDNNLKANHYHDMRIKHLIDSSIQYSENTHIVTKVKPQKDINIKNETVLVIKYADIIRARKPHCDSTTITTTANHQVT